MSRGDEASSRRSGCCCQIDVNGTVGHGVVWLSDRNRRNQSDEVGRAGLLGRYKSIRLGAREISYYILLTWNVQSEMLEVPAVIGSSGPYICNWLLGTARVFVDAVTGKLPP
jgi:hypothetical protein